MKQVFGFTIVITISVLLFSCSKKENTPDEDDQKKGITETELTSVNAYTTRIWFLFLMEEKYVGASGTVDSTIEKSGSQDHNIRFFKDDGDGRGRIYGTYGVGTLDRLLPGVGEWSLSSNGTSLGFTKIRMFPEGGPGGAYTVEYVPEAPMPFPYTRSLKLEQTETLSDGRKVEKRIILGAN